MQPLLHLVGILFPHTGIKVISWFHGYTVHQQCWTLFITNWCT